MSSDTLAASVGGIKEILHCDGSSSAVYKNVFTSQVPQSVSIHIIKDFWILIKSQQILEWLDYDK